MSISVQDYENDTDTVEGNDEFRSLKLGSNVFLY